MQISKKKFVLAVILCSLMAFASGYAVQNVYFNKPHQPMKSEGNVFVTIENEMGTYDIPIFNLITNLGENETATRMRVGATYTECKWISLSDDYPVDQTWTILPTELFRETGTVSDLWLYDGDATFNVTMKKTFDGDYTLRCAGANYGASGNNLYACANFAQTAFANNWNLTITWVFVFNGND